VKFFRQPLSGLVPMILESVFRSSSLLSFGQASRANHLSLSDRFFFFSSSAALAPRTVPSHSRTEPQASLSAIRAVKGR
jgi:hypothetical protein